MCLFATQWAAIRQASLSFSISWSLLKLVSIELMIQCNHLILCHHLLLISIFPSIKVFSNELALHIRWPKYWSFSFSIRPSNEYSGVISFKIVWFDLAVQGTLKSISSTTVVFFFQSYERYYIFFFFSFIFISWRLIILQYCSGFCHTLT